MSHSVALTDLCADVVTALLDLLYPRDINALMLVSKRFYAMIRRLYTPLSRECGGMFWFVRRGDVARYVLWSFFDSMSPRPAWDPTKEYSSDVLRTSVRHVMVAHTIPYIEAVVAGAPEILALMLQDPRTLAPSIREHLRDDLFAYACHRGMTAVVEVIITAELWRDTTLTISDFTVSHPRVDTPELITLLLAYGFVPDSCFLGFLIDADQPASFALCLPHTDVRAPDRYGDIGTDYLCFRAASHGDYDSFCELLGDGRCDPGTQDNYCLIWAARSGHIDVVKALLGDRRVTSQEDAARSLNVAYCAATTKKADPHNEIAALIKRSFIKLFGDNKLENF